ncbi:MAG TPA: hypothetical protein VF271_03615 [Rhodanobacteraceae bacterium]
MAFSNSRTGTLHRRRRMALAWLGIGSALLAMTPLPAWTAGFGWGPALALVASPLLVLLVLDMGLPLRLLKRIKPPRQHPQAVWRTSRARAAR